MNNNDKRPGDAARNSGAGLKDRRRVLGIIGTSAVAVPVLGLAGCGSDDSPGGATTSAPEAARPTMAPMQDSAASIEDTAQKMADVAEDTAGDMADAADEAAAAAGETMESAAAEAGQAAETIASDADAAGEMPRVDENGGQAQGLAYRHDATTVDASVQTRYQPGQQCSNCVLFQGGDDEWGPCPLFAGKQVKATGWCNAYAPRS